MTEQVPSDQSDTPKTDAAAFQLANDLRSPFLAQHVVVPVDFARAQERRIAELENRVGGEVLFARLCRQLIARLAEADANCDPPTDMALRLESIIHERDELREKYNGLLRDREMP